MLVAALVPGAAGAGSVGDTPRLDAVPPPAEAASFRPDPNLVALGKRVFFDPRLSEPRGTACVACHDPARAFAPTLTGEALHAGVPAGSRPGHLAPRSAPSLLYIRYLPRRYFFQDDDASFPRRSVASSPTGAPIPSPSRSAGRCSARTKWATARRARCCAR